MYCNFTKCQAFPFAIRASSQQPKSFLPFYIKPKTPQFLPTTNREKTFRNSSFRFIEKPHEYCKLLGPENRNGSISFNWQQVRKNKEQIYAVKKECFSNGVPSKPRNFSTSYSRKVAEGIGSRKPLPWLAKDPERSGETKRSSWEEPAEKVSKNGVENRGKDRRNVRRKDEKKSRNLEDESATGKVVRSSWQVSAEKFAKNGVENREKGRRFDERKEYTERRSSETDSDVEIQETESPRWYEIKDRFDRYDSVADERNGNEFRRFDRQDNWGKKVWKEATESSIPKMVGECVYGVGPVLAALSANRREFYVLYVQEGIDLSGNNKKKKDKKGFEKVLKVAEKLGLTKKEVSKHDLNMIVDNRPHQGLVLDASPLEMVNICELDRVVTDEREGCPLWLALDEVMDPQNLGAIIRSSYFFGASGVVLCAKNSAPLSGVVSKASAGSLELTELRSCKNMMQFLVSSAENGWRVLGGSVSSRAVALDEVTTSEPTILVLGSEGTGLRPLVERSCTQLVKIRGDIPVHLSAGSEGAEAGAFVAVESLNVSVAAGVLLHHLVGINRIKIADEIKG
ncbi:hypothetical protein L6452_21666 [Arctium lappa]|uniref:Uncharacterized protein n=1 Tax=Arctium lappa TaxID=4217 RepID=A0ACB9AX21_ARCLA|nr:hypothetical protein L6452_21666 [Arctium lappa]